MAYQGQRGSAAGSWAAHDKVIVSMHQNAWHLTHYWTLPLGVTEAGTGWPRMMECYGA